MTLDTGYHSPTNDLAPPLSALRTQLIQRLLHRRTDLRLTARIAGDLRPYPRMRGPGTVIGVDHGAPAEPGPGMAIVMPTALVSCQVPELGDG